MVYFKSAEPFGKHSLVPFTAPISIGKIYYDGDMVFGSLWCNDRCIFSTKRHDPSHDCGGDVRLPRQHYHSYQHRR